MVNINENWTESEKALVMADEALSCIVDSYNEAIYIFEMTPEVKAVLKKFKFAANHAQTCRDMIIKPAVSEAIWKTINAHKEG